MAFGRTLFRWVVALVIFLSCIKFWTPIFSKPSSGRKLGIPDGDVSIFASHAINNTVVVVPVNIGMLQWAANLLCSLTETSFDGKDIVFWALDEGAEDALRVKGYATYRDKRLYASSKNENLHDNTANFKRMVKERPKFFIDLFTSGFDVLFLDADTIYWQSPLTLLPEHTNSVDVVFSTDAREFYQSHNAFEDARRRGSCMPPICTGMFWMKASEGTIALWSDMLDVFQMPGPIGWYRRLNFQDEQRGMDVLLNDGRARVVGPLPEGITEDMVPNRCGNSREPKLNIRLLDQTRVVNGHLLRNRRETYEQSLKRLRQTGDERIAAHFNWDSRDASKEVGSKELGLYLLDEKGNCKLAGARWSEDI